MSYDRETVRRKKKKSSSKKKHASDDDDNETGAKFGSFAVSDTKAPMATGAPTGAAAAAPTGASAATPATGGAAGTAAVAVPAELAIHETAARRARRAAKKAIREAARHTQHSAMADSTYADSVGEYHRKRALEEAKRQYDTSHNRAIAAVTAASSAQAAPATGGQRHPKGCMCDACIDRRTGRMCTATGAPTSIGTSASAAANTGAPATTTAAAAAAVTAAPSAAAYTGGYATRNYLSSDSDSDD